MKTTNEDIEWLKVCQRTAPPFGIIGRILPDLSRLAEIEAARAKGGLTEARRDNLRMLLEPTPLLQTERNEGFRTMLRLDDALRATTAELEKVRGMLRECVLTLRDHGVRNGYNDRIDAARAYLAETEVRDA